MNELEMSRPLVPRTARPSMNIETPQTANRPRKISTACGACKQRKTRCSGGSPCDACSARNSQCVYDAMSDQRRKIANQRNLQELTETQHELEKHRLLLGGIIATIRAGDQRSNHELFRLIKSNIDLSQLAAHVRNECRSNFQIQKAYNEIDFVIDGEEHLPSPTQIFGRSQMSFSETSTEAATPVESSQTHELGPAGDTDEFQAYYIDSVPEE